MTEVMAQRSLGLAAPSSRQDIVSALLNDYGSSFGRGDGSPSAYSPVPALKELPLPPLPRGDSIRNKPLPAVQRMSMKFPLRGKQRPRSEDQTAAVQLLALCDWASRIGSCRK
jgi:hypothetical protein